MALPWVSWYVEKKGGREREEVSPVLIIIKFHFIFLFFLSDLGKILGNRVTIILGLTLEHYYIYLKLNT